MRAMVMAAGLGTRLRPLTEGIPKPVVPVANVAIVEQLVRLLATHGVREVIANLHWFPETVESRVGDGSELGVEVSYRREEELLGTAGGVRNVADFLTHDDEAFLVLAGDALTDVDLTALAAAHRRNRSDGGVATLAVKQVSDVSEYGVIVTGSDGRVQGFQEKPDPAEALSDLVNCMVYAFSPELFDYFPPDDPVDFAHDVFPALLEHDVPFHVHEIDGYWNDIGTLGEYLQGNLDAVEGAVGLPRMAGDLCVDGAPAGIGGDVEVDGRVLFGEGCRIGDGARLGGPLVIGPGAEIGAGARVKQAVVLPGGRVAAGSILARGIAGDVGRLASGEW
ncbi:MAG: NDP-sugar synthase [Actinomycetota bacterium]|nr:NDP-sugar synthase [Actinomycetota bacterium]